MLCNLPVLIRNNSSTLAWTSSRKTHQINLGTINAMDEIGSKDTSFIGIYGHSVGAVYESDNISIN